MDPQVPQTQPQETAPQAATPQPATQTTQANNWPGAFGIYKTSKRAIMLNIWPYLGVLLLSIVVSGIGNTSTDNDTNITATSAVLAIVSLVLGAIVSIAQFDLELTGSNGEKMTFAGAFRKVGSLWLKMLALIIVLVILLVGSALALIVPFFFVLPRLILAPYFLVARDLGPLDAVRASWAESKGHAGKAWGVIGASIVMFLPVFTIIGIPVALYLMVMYSAAFAVLYRYISGKTVEPAAPVAVAPEQTTV